MVETALTTHLVTLLSVVLTPLIRLGPIALLLLIVGLVPSSDSFYFWKYRFLIFAVYLLFVTASVFLLYLAAMICWA